MRWIGASPIRVVLLIGACVLCLTTRACGQDGSASPRYPAVLRDARLAFATPDGTARGPIEDYERIIALPQVSALQSGPTGTLHARVEPLVLDSAQ
jgi:hypothetical protein